MRPRLLFSSLLVASLSLAPAVVRAQVGGGNIDLQAFRPAIDSRGYVTVNASQILGNKEVSFGLVTAWGFKVLEMTGGTGPGAGYVDADRRYEVTNIITPSIQAAFGLFKVIELGVTVPFPIQSGDRGPDFTGDAGNPNDDNEFGFSGQGVGDVGVHAKLRLLNTSKHPVGLAVMGSAYIPAGHEDNKWLGEKGVTVQPMLIIDKESRGGKLKVAVNAGARIRTSKQADRSFTNADIPGTMMNPMIPGTGKSVEAPAMEIPFGAGIAYAVVAQKFDVVGEVFGSVPLGGENYRPLEGIAGIKLYLARNSFFLAGGGAGFLPGVAAGNPDVRGFIGIVFEPNIGDRDHDGIKDDVDKCPDDPEDYDEFEDTDGCPEPDNDRDGLLDEVDRCPNEPEDKDGIEDEDGCPEQDDLDRDGDGIKDSVDQCPDDPEDKDGFQDKDGCPDPDNDQDGILDVDDLCINDPEDKDQWQDEDGCPDPDNDKDRILDKADACPNEPETYNGKDDEDGCPDKGRVVVTSGSIEILDKIYFETNKAIIKPESYPILDAIAATLQGNPDILIVEVGGHADERNTDEYNQKLTQARSEAVKDYFVDKGVDVGRLRPVGYGESKPIDKGHNEEAWSKNRRVEFIILKRASAP